MNSLKPLSVAVKKIAIALAIVSTLAIAAAGQKVRDPNQEGKHYGDPGFRGEPINLNVVNADIRDILSYITDQYGINFVIDKSVGSVPVTVKVNDVPWNMALDSILQAQELGVQVNGNILRVADNKVLATEGELLQARQNSQVDLSPLVTELVRLNFATVTGGASPSATTSGTAVSVTGPSAGAPGLTGGTVSGGGLLPIIKRRLSRRGAIEIDERSNSLIITDVPANIAAIKQLIAILDQPEPQVEIEARIVVASRNFSRDIGVQLFAMVNGARDSGGTFGTQPPRIGSNTSRTGGGQTLNGLPVPSGLPLVGPNNSLFSNIPSTVIGLTTGIFGTATLSSLISLGEQKGQAKVIATPRVTALNNAAAEIKSGTKIPVTTIQPGSGSGGTLIATTTYVDVPLRLSITPQITDVGAVILTITAENSSTSAIVAGSPPAINSQSMQTKVTVPDGGTTVVGGVLFDDERTSQDRTPGLGGIPGLGNLFKRKGVQRNTNEILFFITPRITHQDYQAPTTVRSTPIIQPVPMGNPPSNSTPVEPTPQPIVLQAPGMAKPEAVEVQTPKKPS